MKCILWGLNDWLCIWSLVALAKATEQLLLVKHLTVIWGVLSLGYFLYCQWFRSKFKYTDVTLSAIQRGVRFISMISDLLLCVSLFHSLRLQDLLRPSSLQRLQTNPIHLIQQHRQEACLYAISSMTVWPGANQRVDLIKEQETGGTCPSLGKQLCVDRHSQMLMDETATSQPFTDVAIECLKNAPALKPSLSLRQRESRGQRRWQTGRRSETSWLQPWPALSLHILEVRRAEHHEADSDPDEQMPQGISSATRYSLMREGK